MNVVGTGGVYPSRIRWVIVHRLEYFENETQKNASPAISDIYFLYFQFPSSHVLYCILVNDVSNFQIMVID